jgi:hypothetical protein
VLAAAQPEAPFPLRFFSTPVKTDGQGNVIKDPDNSGGLKDLVGAELAGTRAGLPRYTKIMFSAHYDDGRPRDRLDPNHQVVDSGSAHWPFVNGEVNDTFQDYNIHEPGVVAETTVSNEGPFTRLANDYIFQELGPPQDLGGRQNISSRNTKHLRAFWDSVPRWLNHGAAHSIREILLAPDSPLLRPGERGFNFRTVRTDHQRAVARQFLGGPPIVLPTEVPVTVGDSRGGGLAGPWPATGKDPSTSAWTVPSSSHRQVSRIPKGGCRWIVWARAMSRRSSR